MSRPDHDLPCNARVTPRSIHDFCTPKKNFGSALSFKSRPHNNLENLMPNTHVQKSNANFPNLAAGQWPAVPGAATGYASAFGSEHLAATSAIRINQHELV